MFLFHNKAMNDLKVIGAAVGSGSHDTGTKTGVEVLKAHLKELSFDIIHENPSGKGLEALYGLVEFNQRLAQQTLLTKLQGDFPLVIGGDHSCAIGTWSGVSAFYGEPLGMLWIDAHLDAHTFETSETGNIHGMPVATLLGYGEKELTHLITPKPKLDAERLVIFGVRSFEEGEELLLESLGVRVFTMNEIFERGFRSCFAEAVEIVTSNSSPFGISLDLDGLDPEQIPGVGTAVPAGLDPVRVFEGLKPLFSHERLSGFEVVEFNPLHDRNNMTLQFLLKLCRSLFSLRKNRRFILKQDIDLFFQSNI